MASTIEQALSQILQRYPDIELAILFGSTATATEGVDSDIDLAVLAGVELSSDLRMALIAEIGDCFGRPVDIVDLAVIGPVLASQVIKGKRLLGTDASYARFITRYQIDRADFLPIHQRTLKERRDRWIQ